MQVRCVGEGCACEVCVCVCVGGGDGEMCGKRVVQVRCVCG